MLRHTSITSPVLLEGRHSTVLWGLYTDPPLTSRVILNLLPYLALLSFSHVKNKQHCVTGTVQVGNSIS